MGGGLIDKNYFMEMLSFFDRW